MLPPITLGSGTFENRKFFDSTMFYSFIKVSGRVLHLYLQWNCPTVERSRIDTVSFWLYLCSGGCSLTWNYPRSQFEGQKKKKIEDLVNKSRNRRPDSLVIMPTIYYVHGREMKHSKSTLERRHPGDTKSTFSRGPSLISLVIEYLRKKVTMVLYPGNLVRCQKRKRTSILSHTITPQRTYRYVGI